MSPCSVRSVRISQPLCWVAERPCPGHRPGQYLLSIPGSVTWRGRAQRWDRGGLPTPSQLRLAKTTTSFDFECCPCDPLVSSSRSLSTKTRHRLFQAAPFSQGNKNVPSVPAHASLPRLVDNIHLQGSRRCRFFLFFHLDGFLRQLEQDQSKWHQWPKLHAVNPHRQAHPLGGPTLSQWAPPRGHSQGLHEGGARGDPPSWFLPRPRRSVTCLSGLVLLVYRSPGRLGRLPEAEGEERAKRTSSDVDPALLCRIDPPGGTTHPHGSHDAMAVSSKHMVRSACLLKIQRRV